MLYGHRNDLDGYAKAATVFDKALHEFMTQMRDEDILIITADHGCDPGFKGTDHSREYTPMLMYGKDVKGDIAQTILDIFEIDKKLQSESFWNDVKEK